MVRFSLSICLQYQIVFGRMNLRVSGIEALRRLFAMPWAAAAAPQNLQRQERSHADPNPITGIAVTATIGLKGPMLGTNSRKCSVLNLRPSEAAFS
jgi:hypothetical protein